MAAKSLKTKGQAARLSNHNLSFGNASLLINKIHGALPCCARKLLPLEKPMFSDAAKPLYFTPHRFAHGQRVHALNSRNSRDVSSVEPLSKNQSLNGMPGSVSRK